MGVNIGRIEKEFILSNVIDKKIPLVLNGKKERKNGMLVDYDKFSLTIESSDSDWDSFEDCKISIFLTYYGHTMTFDSEIIDTKKNKIKVKYPEGIYKSLSRKYIRVPPPEDAKISFVVRGTKIVLNFPKSEEYYPAEFNEGPEEFTSTRIEELIAQFKEKITPVSTSHRIKMFRGKTPEGMEENLLARYGKMLYFDVQNSQFYRKIDEEDETEEEKQKVPTDQMISREMVEDLLKELGFPAGKAIAKVSELFQKRKDKALREEVYCPILFHEYVVGYIQVSLRKERPYLDGDMLLLVHQFSKILAYALKINNYFKGEKPHEEEFEAEIIDISASGLLFAHSSAELSAYLMLYTDLELLLHLGKRKMVIGSRVMRKIKDSGVTYYGIQFLEIQPEDFRYLFDFVYGRPFTEEDEKTWEGGAAPPDLEIFSS